MKLFLPETGKLLGAFCLTFFLFFNVYLGVAQTVTTDKDDYQPGDIVEITGLDWQAYESVNLHIISDCGCTDVTYTVTSDASGAIFNNDLNITEDHIGASFVLTATGDSGSIVQTTFTDSGSFSYTTTSGFNNSVSLVPGSSNSSSLSVNVESPKNNGNFDVSLSYNNTGSPTIGIGTNANEINFSSIINSYVTTNKDGDTHSFPISVSVGSAVPPGTYNFQVTGIESAGNIQDGPRWDFEVVVGSTGSRIDALSVGTQSQQIECGIGGTTNYTITATRGGSGTVNGTYSVSGLPSGVNSNFSVENFTSSGSDSFPNTVLTLTAPSGLSVGNYSFNVFLTDGSDQATNTGSLSVSDTFPPSWSTALNSLDRTVDCSDVSALANAQSLFPEATDICDPDVSNIVKTAGAFVAASCSSKGTYTNTWTVTDDSGNVSTVFTQTITVEDTTNPTFTVPGDLTIECDQDETDLTLTGDVTDEADNCDGSIGEATYSDSVAAGSCGGNYVITRTWTLSDACGNTESKDQTITVEDTTNPTFTVPGDLTIECDQDETDLTLTGDVTDEADNCDGSIGEATYSDSVAAGSCGGNYVITRTWTLSDACGNTESKDQTITVEDTTNPTFTVPGDLTIECDQDETDLTLTGDVTDEADNCDGSIGEATYSDSVAAGSCGGNYVITRTWILSDECGNTESKDQTITVEDTTNPTFTVPGDLTIECDQDETDLTLTGDVTDEADNCDGSIGEATYSDSVAAGSCGGNYVITRTWILSDECGNTESKDQTITVEDTTNPTFTVPGDLTIECDQDETDLTLTGDVTDEADNCDGSIGEATYSDSVAAGSCGGNYVITRTWTLSDECGNTESKDQTITVEDTTNPTFTVPGDLTIECDQDETDLTLTGDVTDEADNCDGSIGEATYSDSVAAGSCGGNYVITRTWILSDECGNTESKDQTITVEDTTNPTFTVPGDLTIECDQDETDLTLTGDVTDEADNCDGSIGEATYSDSVAAGSCGGNYVITRTWTLSDECGNTESKDQTITVEDTTNPTFTVPGDLTIECDQDETDLTLTGDVTDEADNCDGSIGEATYSDSVAAGSCGGNYVITRTWILSDECGNTESKDQTITVEDTTNPTFTVPGDLTIECDQDETDLTLTGDVTDEADNCDGSIGEATYSDSVAAGSCGGNYVITRTWILSDECGNTESKDQTITVEDTTNPTFTVPGDLTIECDQDETDLTLTGDVTDEADNCDGSIGEATYSDSVAAGSCGGNYVITRTWILSDACGNTESKDQIITVEDTTAPDLDPIQPLNPIAVNDTFTIQAPSNGDNCSGVTATWYFDPDGGILDPLDAAFDEPGIFNGSFVQGTFDSSIFETPENPTGTGVYSVMLVVTDACGNESVEVYDYVVIYDPSGGFVTGGGWFYSEPEYLIDNPDNSEGKANFGFNAKYKSGKNNTTEVDGHTNFQFKEGNFHFKSSSHADMSLVISGGFKATYTGMGTVNNDPTLYNFRVTVIDADQTPNHDTDLFRIKIWDGGTTIYDNNINSNTSENADPSTAIGGGSIVIHKPKGGGKDKTMESTEKTLAQSIEPEIPDNLKTLEVAPNPMSEYCDIRFSLKQRLKADLLIFDMNGRQLRKLYSSVMDANELIQVRFERGNLPSGVYICKLITGDGHSYERQIIIE